MTPNEGRALWQQLLDGITEETPFNPVLQHVIMGVLIDIIEKRMGLSDTFAVTIGTRIAFLNKAMEEHR